MGASSGKSLELLHSAMRLRGLKSTTAWSFELCLAMPFWCIILRLLPQAFAPPVKLHLAEDHICSAEMLAKGYHVVPRLQHQ